VVQLSFDAREPDQWFEEFAARILAAVGREFLPVLRLYDGEFCFSVGYRLPLPPQRGYTRSAMHYLREALSYVRWTRATTYRGGGNPAYALETYGFRDWRRLRKRWIECLREIAADGILALGLFENPTRFAEQYLEPMCGWMDRHGIVLSDRNYYPFYFVYALLNGWSRERLLAGRHVLVVTSPAPGKWEGIGAGLLARGAARVTFAEISATRAMESVVDLGAVPRPVDLVLVAAGVGAANVLVQLRELGTVCIDAGFSLDLLADPRLEGARDFTARDAR
jgi:hypothetical protein